MFNFRRLLALFKSEPLSPYDSALRDLAHGRNEEGLAALTGLLAAESAPARRAEIANKCGVALVALGRTAQAAAAFEEALANVPEFPRALVNLGNMELDAGKPQDAIAYYRRAIARDAELATAHRHLGLALKRTGDMNGAMSALGRARKLEGRGVRRQRT